MRSRTESTPALLLRSVDYGDADRIVTLLTQRFGKGTYIARAARRSKKRFGSALQPLALLQVQIAGGRGALAVLAQAEVLRAYPRLLSDLARMNAGFAALELLRELSPEHEPDPGVFATAVALLGALDGDQGEVDPERLLLCFEARVLALTGFAPRLDRCGHCGRVADPHRAALFDARQGHVVCRACGGAPHHLSGAARGLLTRAASGDFVATAQGPFSAADRDAIRLAMRAFVEQRIGRPLKAASTLPAIREER